MCRLARGEIDAAGEAIGRAVALAHESGQPALEASWLVEQGKIALARRRPAEAEQAARAALRIARRREHALTTFRAEWLLHRIARLRDPLDPDRARLTLLAGLYPRIDQHEGIDEIQEYKRAILSAGGEKGDRR
jgi:hypothetical protein